MAPNTNSNQPAFVINGDNGLKINGPVEINGTLEIKANDPNGAITVSDNGNITSTSLYAQGTAVEAEAKAPELTLGQKIVGVRFNPSGMTEVDIVKQQFAQFIDDCRARFNTSVQRTWEVAPDNDACLSGPIVHQNAINQLETACMHLVKSIVTQ